MLNFPCNFTIFLQPSLSVLKIHRCSLPLCVVSLLCDDNIDDKCRKRTNERERENYRGIFTESEEKQIHYHVGFELRERERERENECYLIWFVSMVCTQRYHLSHPSSQPAILLFSLMKLFQFNYLEMPISLWFFFSFFFILYLSVEITSKKR